MLKGPLLPLKVQDTYANYFETWLTKAKTRTIRKKGNKVKALVIIIPQEILGYIDLKDQDRVQVAIRKWPQKPVPFHRDNRIVSSQLQPHVGVTTSTQTKPVSVLHKCGASHVETSRGITALTRRIESRMDRMYEFPSQADTPHDMNENSTGNMAKSKVKNISSQYVFPVVKEMGDMGIGVPHITQDILQTPHMNEKEECFSYVNTLGTGIPTSSPVVPSLIYSGVNS